MHRWLRVAELREGMVLHSDVFDGGGRLLASAGTRLTRRHLDGFALWRIEDVEIAVASERAARSPQHLDERTSVDVEEQLRAVFANVDLEHRFAKRLFERCLERRIARGPEGGPPLSPRLPNSKSNPPTSITSRPAPGSLDWVRKARTLPSLPAVYHRLIAVMDHPRSSSADIAKVLREDTGLSTRLLRLANSAMFGFPGRIEVVSHALSLIGTAQVRELALATSVLSVFADVPACLLDMESFWRHSLACAVAARSMAKEHGQENIERFFVMGMLHDVGRLLSSQQRPDVFAQALKAARDHGVPLHHAERDVLGHTAAEAGAALLEMWNIPVRQRDAVGCQHAPERAGPHAMDASIIHLSNAVAIAMQVGSSGERRVPPIAAFAWESLALAPSVIPRIIDEVDSQLTSIADVILRSP